jgi:hypothetical protein
MKSEGSLSCSQKPATVPDPQLVKSMITHLISLRFILYYAAKCFFPSRFPDKTFVHISHISHPCYHVLSVSSSLN